MTFVTIELNKQMRKEVTGSSPVGGIFGRLPKSGYKGMVLKTIRSFAARGFESHIFLYLNLYEWSDFITISRETAPTVRMKKLE